MVSVQRKFNTIFQKFDDYKNRIGKIYSIHGHYTLNIARLDEGWRSKQELAGGGALLDMGYHLVDLLIWYFGLPDSVTCRLGYNNRENQDYNVEDTAKILFDYNLQGSSILGSLLISRIYPTKEETLTIYGTQGTIEIKKNQISLLDIEKEVIESLVSNDKNKPIYDQLDYFINWVSNRDDSEYSYKQHFDNVSFVEACYNSHLNNNTEVPKSYLF
jgi:predicted dehydrogenase